jgi:hypothetical protein
VTPRKELPAYGLAVLILGAIVALILTHHPVPELMWVSFTGALSGGLGLTIPGGAVGAVEADVTAAIGRLERALVAPAPPTAPPASSAAPARPAAAHVVTRGAP